MKKIIAILASFMVAFSINNTIAFAATNPPVLCEDSVVLMDSTTGEILFSKNMDTAYPPASTTKTMTALLTLELCKFDTMVTVGKNPPRIAAGTSNISLAEGEEISVKDLLYGLILRSGNDCAETLAEYIGGSSEHFAVMMNARAKELGCTNTNFINPSGLYNVNHKTSARDLALIMRELEKHPEFKTISTTLSYKTQPNAKCPTGHPMSNENKIVNFKSYNIPGYDGSKTGYTTEALFSFTAAATRNNQQLVLALVHGSKGSFYAEAKELFDYGFNNFELVKLYNKGDKVVDYKITDTVTIPLLANEDYYYLRPKDSKDIPKISLPQTDLSKQTIKTGDILLTTSYTLKDQPLISKLKLKSGADYSPKITKSITTLAKKKSTNFVILIFIPILLASLFIALRRRKLRKYRHN